MFPTLGFFALSSLLASILQSNNRFFAASISPVSLNIMLILSMIVFSNQNITILLYGMSFAVLLSAAVHFVIHLYAVDRLDFKLYLRKPRVTDDTKIFASRFFNSFLSNGMTEIGIWINTVIASILPSANLLYILCRSFSTTANGIDWYKVFHMFYYLNFQKKYLRAKKMMRSICKIVL